MDSRVDVSLTSLNEDEFYREGKRSSSLETHLRKLGRSVGRP